MTKSIYFSLGIHNHQPVGNFDFVIERAYEMSYKPLINFFFKHPDFPINVHFSGFLLLWLEKNHPEYFEKLKIMAERGQIEFVSGGFYEPILPIIPDKDKVQQIKKLNKYIYDKFGQTPKGMWLAERVWEPHLVKYIAEAGIEYVVVDDAHFFSVGLKEEDLFGYYLMEEQGYKLAVFPISMKLRYLIPFADPEETITYLDKFASEDKSKIALLFDDGEKFGLWPDTYRTVYEEGWLERFVSKIKENFLLVTPVNLYTYMQRVNPKGRIYLPTASYREMMEWVLFPEAQKELEELVEKLKTENLWDKFSPYVKGGFWRNFLAKYDESNHMQKKMLYVWKKVQDSPNEEVKEKAMEEVFQGQANDAYWHGIFGGLYLPHLRTAIYEHLIKAENYLENSELHFNIFDFDCDGNDEIIVESPFFNLYLSPNHGGSVLEWDFKTKAFNLTNVLTRRKEAYHSKLSYVTSEAQGKSIHERWTAKEEGLENILFYDNHRRVSFTEKIFKSEPVLEDLWKDSSRLEVDSFYENYDYEINKDENKIRVLFSRVFRGFELCKSYILYKDKSFVDVVYEIKNVSETPISLNFGWEINLNFLAPNHPDYYFLIGDQKYPLSSFGIEKVNNWKIFSGIGIELECVLDVEASLYRYPIETVSLSEEGFERVYQGSALIHFYKVDLPVGSTWRTTIRFWVK
ncbi:DUF1926 domain-containing protein [Dictyoglomus thermophilum]|uniref:alpha-amylase AmyA n=1 Tax=Dictyoglomus thermophilum TaxID=14 RepID=UPI0011EB4566|nr:alpha-amylase AmyA [Dictyoglomus thermophilum]TYT22860.1 DUF1926 domain-containing protein [Dictyoglomus thermophilum]